MKNLRITNRVLEDGSIVHQVRFDATHADSTEHTVTLEAYDRKAVARLYYALDQDVAYAETDPQ